MNKAPRAGLKQGIEQAERLKSMGVIKQDNIVLDVGCGWGRLAYGLLSTGFAGRYIGIDIVKGRIDWLSENFAPVHTNYSFHHSDVRNGMYNPRGSETRIPYGAILAETRPDAIILLSVYTHMFKDDVAASLRDIAALMRPDSILLFSCFLVDGIAAARIEQGETTWRFPHHVSDDCRCEDRSNPLEAIGYTEPALMSLVEAAGLKGNAVRGTWSTGKHSPAAFGQDIVVARKQ